MEFEGTQFRFVDTAAFGAKQDAPDGGKNERGDGAAASGTQPMWRCW